MVGAQGAVAADTAIASRFVGALLFVQSSYDESYPFLHFPFAHGGGPALHSSLLCLPSLAVKKRVLPTAVRFVGSLLLLPRRMSLTIVVPRRVPLLRQSSSPCLLSVAAR